MRVFAVTVAIVASGALHAQQVAPYEPGEQVTVRPPVSRSDPPVTELTLRVVAAPGDRVRVGDNAPAIYVNDRAIDGFSQDFVARVVSRPERIPVVVPEGHYFVMGEQRNNQNISEYWGQHSGARAFFPVLAVVRWAKTAENATDYSLNNTVRNMLFLPCTRDQKYGGKQAIDSFFVRIGDVLSAALVFVGTTYFALGGSGFARLNILIVTGWLVLAFFVGREYTRLATTGSQPGPRLVGAREAADGALTAPSPG